MPTGTRKWVKWVLGKKEDLALFISRCCLQKYLKHMKCIQYVCNKDVHLRTDANAIHISMHSQLYIKDTYEAPTELYVLIQFTMEYDLISIRFDST